MTLQAPLTAEESAFTRSDPSSLLRIRNLSVRFDTPGREIRAVNGIDVNVGAGEVFALVGESGSGKSVSMLSVMGLVPTPPAVVTGSILFDGLELVGLGRSKMNAIRGGEIGMVFQDPMSSLNPVHRIGRQIAEVLHLHQKISRRDAMDQAGELLDKVGIPNAGGRLKDYPHEFSGGMRQRVMIAIALACGPRLLIADEPTTALDVTVQRQIVTLVQQLQADLGMAVIWITHDLGVVAEIADRVAVMYGGRIVETGNAADLYRTATHPYTSGLLHSIPRTDTIRTEWLPEIPGTPVQLVDDLLSCPFHSRCPMGDDSCVASLPTLEASGREGQFSACVHHASILDGGDLWPSLDREVTAAVEHGDELLVSIEGLKVHFPVERGGRARRKAVVLAVDGVDLELRRGRTLGIVGESGCGKSTLGRALVGLVEATDGRVLIKGEPLDTSSGPHRRTVQMIFQDPFSSMNPGMRVGDVVAEPMRVHNIGSADERSERVAKLLGQVGIPAEAATRHPHEFSGGQRQRIAIARALAANPEVIVCDEPVSALDVSVQAQIVNLLHETQLETGVSLIFIAHDLAVVRHISHEVAVMYLGQVVERAPRDDIYETPLHPYTKALLAAVPVPDPSSSIALAPPLEGDLPDPSDPPTGCRFHTRCPVAVIGLCDEIIPELRVVDTDRWVACHLVEASTDQSFLAGEGDIRGDLGLLAEQGG
ncbi:MAG: ABC transporter ATP-binding protein [Actinomycetota bacterium]|nr:ABC transporter ATP-binding protein [Actinomycetota bacterium]